MGVLDDLYNSYEPKGNDKKKSNTGEIVKECKNNDESYLKEVEKKYFERS